ncbi:MAG: MurR/RpiR family transcriptional regulator [Clostridia bacterium]
MPAKMKIRSAYNTLPSAERKVADFILQNPEKASLMVINEIADASGVSVPSVTRLAKKLGYDGFLDFRVALASGSASLDSLKSDPIRPEDADAVVIEKTFLASMRALEDTLKATDRVQLSLLASKITQAKRIFVLGVGSSAQLSQDLVFQLNFMGYDAVCVSDPVVMEMYSRRFTDKDVLIGVSRTGRTKVILDTLKEAKRHGTYCAFMSNFVNSPATQVADSFFCTCRVDDIKQILNRESNLAMYALTAALLVLVARKTGYEED